MAEVTGQQQHVQPDNLDELLDFMDGQIAALERHPDEATRQAVLQLLQANDALHWQALQRLATFLGEQGAEHLLAEAAQADPFIRAVLSLYDLLSDETAVNQVEVALAQVRPYIESHGGELKLVTVEDGVVHVEMGGACHGCAGSTFTLQRGIRKALEEGYPGFQDVVVHEPAAQTAGGLIGLDQIYVAPSMLQAPDFQPVLALSDVPAGMMQQVEISEMRLLIANVAGDIYAVADQCPGSSLPLSAGELHGAIVQCPWHQEKFDLRQGVCVDKAGRRDEPARLAVYPVAVQGEQILVAVNVPARPIVVNNEQ